MWVFAALTKPFLIPTPPDSWERDCFSSRSNGGQMFEFGMKQLTLVINDRALDCTWWVVLLCVGNGTSVVGRALSSSRGSILFSLHPAGEKWLIFLNSASSSSGGFKVVEFPYALLFLFWKGRDTLERAGRKQRSIKTKSCDNSIQKCGVREVCFHALPNFLIQAVPFGEPRVGGNLQRFVCQQPMAPSPSLCDLFLLCTVHWASGKAGAGNWAAPGLFQFMKTCCCHLDKGDLRREGNPLNSASSNSRSHHPWQQSCPQRELD